MALTKCKECSADIAENARCCPKCGFTSADPKRKWWFEAFTTLSGPFILSAAGTVLAYMTFVHQTETQETEQNPLLNKWDPLIATAYAPGSRFTWPAPW